MASVNDVYNQLVTANTTLGELHGDMLAEQNDTNQVNTSVEQVDTDLKDGFSVFSADNQVISNELSADRRRHTCISLAQTDTVICNLDKIAREICVLVNEAAKQTASTDPSLPTPTRFAACTQRRTLRRPSNWIARRISAEDRRMLPPAAATTTTVRARTLPRSDTPQRKTSSVAGPSVRRTASYPVAKQSLRHNTDPAGSPVGSPSPGGDSKWQIG